MHKIFCAIPFNTEFEYCTGDVPQEDSKSIHTLDMQINGVAPYLTRWARDLKDLTASPLTRDYPEPQLQDGLGQDCAATESIEASMNVQDGLQ